MKDVNNSKMVQASTEIDKEFIDGLKAIAKAQALARREAQLEAADRIVNQLAGIIARVKGRA